MENEWCGLERGGPNAQCETEYTLCTLYSLVKPRLYFSKQPKFCRVILQFPACTIPAPGRDCPDRTQQKATFETHSSLTEEPLVFLHHGR